MSILEDFARGFLTTYQGDMLKKQQREEERLERKRLTNERLAEEARRRKLDQMDRRQARDEELAAARQGEGYNPETGMVEWIDGKGNPGSRKATAAERAAYQSSLSAAERQEEQDKLDAEYKRSQIDKNNRWQPYTGGGGSNERPLSREDAVFVAMTELGVDDPNDPAVQRKANQIFSSGLTRGDLANRPTTQGTGLVDFLTTKFGPAIGE